MQLCIEERENKIKIKANVGFGSSERLSFVPSAWLAGHFITVCSERVRLGAVPVPQRFVAVLGCLIVCTHAPWGAIGWKTGRAVALLPLFLIYTKYRRNLILQAMRCPVSWSCCKDSGMRCCLSCRGTRLSPPSLDGARTCPRPIFFSFGWTQSPVPRQRAGTGHLAGVLYKGLHPRGWVLHK